MPEGLSNNNSIKHLQNGIQIIEKYRKDYTFAEAQREKIYVLDEGKSLMLALSQDLEQNRPVEAREHVRRFHELFFTLSPDKSAIEGNIQRAMFLSDRSAYANYVDLAEQGYYNRIISGNMSQRIGIDSVRCDFNTYPYEVVTYAKLSIIREKSVTERSLVTQGNRCRKASGFVCRAFSGKENVDSHRAGCPVCSRKFLSDFPRHL